MSLGLAILLAVVLSPAWLLVLYAVVIQYERGGLWRMLVPFAAVAAVLDGLLAHTYFALLVWDYPRRGEWTFSQQLGRLVTRSDWRGRGARDVAAVLDWLAPSGRHIKPRPT